MTKNETLAWAAGLFDGEGWITVNGRGLQLGVGQKDPRVLAKFQIAVGTGGIFEERNNEFFSWRASRMGAVYGVLRQLWPYLSDFKKEQITDAVSRLREVRAPLKRRVAEVEMFITEIERLVGDQLAEHSRRS